MSSIYNNHGTAIHIGGNHPSKDAVIKNNIIYSNGGSVVVEPGGSTATIDHNYTQDPQFVSAPTDFHLQSSSPAKTASDTGGEVGAYGNGNTCVGPECNRNRNNGSNGNGQQQEQCLPQTPSANDLVRKRSRGYHGYTNLAKVESEADHGNVAVPASVLTGHRITSCAWKSTLGGIVRPRAVAVFRLMTSSKRVGCSTGKSAGLAPFRILSMYMAPRRNNSGRLAP